MKIVQKVLIKNLAVETILIMSKAGMYSAGAGGPDGGDMLYCIGIHHKVIL